MIGRDFSREIETVRKGANGNTRNENKMLEMKYFLYW